MLLLLTARMMLITPQDAHAQTLTVDFDEPTGTQLGSTFDVPIMFNHNIAYNFTASDFNVTTTRTQRIGMVRTPSAKKSQAGSTSIH